MKREPGVIYFSELTSDVLVDETEAMETRAELALALSRLSPVEQDRLFEYVQFDGDIAAVAEWWEVPISVADEIITEILRKARGELQ